MAAHAQVLLSLLVNTLLTSNLIHQWKLSNGVVHFRHHACPSLIANSNTKDSSMSAPTSIKSTQISPDFVKLFSPPSPDPAATESARFTEEERRLAREGKESLQKLKEFVNSDLNAWTQDRHSSKEVLIFSRYLKLGKRRNQLIFRSEGELPFNYKLIFKELWEQGETLPEWNSQVEIFHYLKEISSNFIIGYQITAPLAFGLVSQRDFVGLAHYEFEESKNTLWLTTVSVEFSGMPELEKYVRGFHLPGSGVKLEASQESPENKTIFTWIFIPDLKFGYIPSSIMKKVLPAQIKLYYESLRARLFQVYPSNHL